jgi:tRNA G10  N-methylase Trm11
VVQLLEKVTSELAMLKWRIDESGENITAQYPSDSSFITLMEISKTTALKTCNLLMHLLTSESTADANFEMGNGSSHVKSAESLRAWILNTTNGRMELALGVVNVVLTTLSQINEKEPQQRNNSHSTVKPITLMRYLIRLVTPPGGTVLDPFMGSGSTGCAAMLEAMQFIGIELSAEYLEIARRRIEFHEYTVREKNPMGL